jgi:2-polyprenyl-3-methyl-5-hydroxy-6-metoxy-1,4-benzoquinol methylase
MNCTNEIGSIFLKNGISMIRNEIPADGYYSLVRPEILGKVPTKAVKILDVGCGHGNLGKALKDSRDLEYYGVEVSEPAEKFLNQICDKYWIGDLEKLNLEDLPNFDCLIVADILEHLSNPWDILKNLVKKLDYDGVAIISIPNIRNLNIIAKLLIKGNWDYEESGILDRTHLRFFTRKSVVSLITSSNLEIVSIASNKDQYGLFRGIATWPIRKMLPDLEISQFIVVAKKNSR